jgi:NAD dependent epimerase/dehydratase family enzyme
MKALRTICRVPIGLPATHWMLEIGAFFLRTETELIIKSRRVIPGRLVGSGFEFQVPTISEAFQMLNRGAG